MRPGWQLLAVGELVARQRNALVGGPFGSNLVTSDYVPTGVPVIRGQNMGSGRWVTGEFAYVSPQKAESLAANLARPGDLIFTQRGTLGQVAILPFGQFDKYLVSQSQMKLTPDPDKADVLFLYYAFKSPEQQRHIINSAIQTGVPHTNLSILRATTLRLPPLPEQKAIAILLGVLDDKIELNRRMNETLETIARAIFEEMFAQPTGSDPPNLLFSQIAQVSREGLNPGDHPNEVFEHYSIPAFDEQQLPSKETGEQIKSNKFRVPTDSVLLSKLNPRIPRVWLPAVSENHRSICSTEFLVLRPKPGFSQEFIYGLCSSKVFQEVFATMVTGTSGSHQRVKPEYLEKMAVGRPDLDGVRKFTALVSPIHARVAHNLQENSTAAALRDTLLPKLISGEIRLRGAAAFATAL